MGLRYWFILAVLLISSLATASSGKFVPCYRDDHYLAEGLLQISADDLNGDGKDELLVIGRDYVDPQAVLYVLNAENQKPELAWQSQNMMEEKSPILLTTGSFTGDNQRQAAVLTDHHLTIFEWSKDQGYHPILTISHNLCPWEVTAGDWNQDGMDELLVTRAEKSNARGFIKRIEVYQVVSDHLKLMAVSPNLGNIRSLTMGDIDNDGRAEVIIDEGKTSEPGNFTVFTAGDAHWTPKIGPVKVVKAAVYGMVTIGKEGQKVLYTASDRGKVNAFTWNDGKFEQTMEISFSAGLVAIAAGKLWNDRLGIATLAYPQSFRLLAEGDAP